MVKLKSVLLAASGLIAMAPSVVSAQTQPDANATASTSGTTASGDQVGAIIVTARKRAENVLSVPVAITAFTGADLVARDVKTMSDLANFTPSLTDDTASAGGARVDRTSALLVIRGMNPSNSTVPTTSIFINGAPVAAADFLQNLDDVDHVEVLKGPQAAYFGRSTFAGAVNVVARSAGNTLSGDYSVEVGSRNTFTGSASLTIPIIDDVLSVRVGGQYDTHDGSYRNAFNPQQTLGDQETKTGHVAITFKPASNLTIKAFGMYFEDNDGPAATGLLLADGPSSDGGPSQYDQHNCTVGGAAFFCGTLPGLMGSVTPAQATVLTPAEHSFLSNPGGLFSASNTIQKFGLKRKGTHGDLSAQYDIPDTGLTLSYLGGFNYDNFSEISDLAITDTAPGGQYPGYNGYSFLPGSAGIQGFPFLVEFRNHDWSQEARLASDPTKRFHVLVGGSYVKSYQESVNSFIVGSPSSVGSPLRSETSSAFFSLSFDILQNLNLTAEGRYLSDKEIADNVEHQLVAQGTSHNFVPRASLQYKFSPDAMVYATYSKGVNPSQYNNFLASIPAVSTAKLNAEGFHPSTFVQPEKLDNYEVGLKGRFLDGRATLAVAAYYDRWNHQISTDVYNFAQNDPANPYNVPGYSEYKPNSSVFIAQFNDNSASSTAKGVEGEATIIPVRYVTLNLSGAINDTKYRSYLCTSGCGGYSAANPFQAAGKHLPNAPEYSGTIGGQYQHPFTYAGASNIFARIDYIYHSGLFISPDNAAKTPTSNTVNLRAGINWDHFALEGFVNNVLNNRAYTTGFQDDNFAGGFTPAAFVGLPQLITAGFRVRANF